MKRSASLMIGLGAVSVFGALVVAMCPASPAPAQEGTAPPATMTVPRADADGAYTVSWGASATPGVTYVLEESTDPSFGSRIRAFPPTSALRKQITRRSQGRTYYYRVLASKAGFADSAWRTGGNGCAVPGAGAAKPPANISVPAAAAGGAFEVTWGASATAGVTYLLEEASSPTFESGLRVAYAGKARTAGIAGRAQDATYYYRVRAVKAGLRDSARKSGASGCAVPGEEQVEPPASITVPVSAPGGDYVISWDTAATPQDGVIYVLEEATDPTLTVGLRVVHAGAELSKTLSGQARNTTYYYRVKAIKAGWRDSAYRTGATGCAVPGAASVGMPASITVPSSDADGNYTVTWGASATKGAKYVLEEARNAGFTEGWRIAYSGASLGKTITGRNQGDTYHYRVSAVKPGLRDSTPRTAAQGCTITSLELEPYAYKAYLQWGGPLETVFTMDKPKGWEVDIAGMCSTLAFRMYDPAEPLSRVFYFGQIWPVYLDPATKAQDELMCSLLPEPCAYTWVDAPVVNPLTVENFFLHWPQVAAMKNAAEFMPSFPPLDGIDVISNFPQPPMIGAGETALLRGVFTFGVLNPKAGQGQFLASVLPGPLPGLGGGYIVFGATAPTREFKGSVGRMVQSLNSFSMTGVYYNWCVAQQQQTWGAVAQAGQTLREASDIIWEGWQSRTAAQDITAYRHDDTLRNVEKLWDPGTGNVYEFAAGFYDQYSLDPSAYNISTLQPMPEGRVDLWEGTILNGPAYVY